MCPLFLNFLFFADMSCILWSMNGKCTLYLWWIYGDPYYGLLNSGLNHFNLIYFFLEGGVGFSCE